MKREKIEQWKEIRSPKVECVLLISSQITLDRAQYTEEFIEEHGRVKRNESLLAGMFKIFSGSLFLSPEYLLVKILVFCLIFTSPPPTRIAPNVFKKRVQRINFCILQYSQLNFLKLAGIMEHCNGQGHPWKFFQIFLIIFLSQNMRF